MAPGNINIPYPHQLKEHSVEKMDPTMVWNKEGNYSWTYYKTKSIWKDGLNHYSHIH
jgi:hypothetical protein